MLCYLLNKHFMPVSVPNPQFANVSLMLHTMQKGGLWRILGGGGGENKYKYCNANLKLKNFISQGWIRLQKVSATQKSTKKWRSNKIINFIH